MISLGPPKTIKVVVRAEDGGSRNDLMSNRVYSYDETNMGNGNWETAGREAY